MEASRRSRLAPRQDLSVQAVPLILDAEPGVPWLAAMQVVDLGRELAIPELQFALGPAERP